ncbi:MAG: hypothetical protein LC733_10845, partial [Actinobacteria bacterium]|nr:hypothetical protein [Actinomycetota bacterium]
PWDTGPSTGSSGFGSEVELDDEFLPPSSPSTTLPAQATQPAVTVPDPSTELPDDVDPTPPSPVLTTPSPSVPFSVPGGVNCPRTVTIPGCDD